MENAKDTVLQHDTIFKLKAKLLQSIEGIQENLQDFKGEGHFDGVEDHVLYHGLRKHYTFKAGQFYTDLTCSPLQKEYLLVSPSKSIARYGLHGREISPPYRIETTRFLKLTWASTIQCFLCWGHELNEIYVAQPNFVFLYRAHNSVSIVQVLYDEGTKTVIAAGENIITRYNYVLGTKVLQKKDDTIFKSFESNAVVITLCTLAPYDTGSQRLFISYLNNVYVLNLDTRSLVHTRKSIHSLSITALMLYVPVMWLITGDSGGTVKCWDAEWNLTMVFIGHTSSVLQLLAHPSLCGFISVGGDNTLQVWSCNLRDKVERIDLPDAVSFVVVNKVEECLVTLSARSGCIDLWYMHLLYSHHCALHTPAIALLTPVNARRPCRTLVVTGDSMVRVVSPLTGVQLTVQHVPPVVSLGCIAYGPDSEIIYSIVNPKGHVLLSYANENPVNFWKVWLRDHRSPPITVIEVYEQVANIYEKRDSPLGKSMQKAFGMEHSLIFAGREDGTIASLDNEFGSVEFVTTGHTSSVKSLLANPAMNQLVSCGEDNSIKVWRVFTQHRIEPIVLYVSLYYAETIASITTLREVLCLAVSGKRSITHTVIMYNVTDKLRHDHSPHRDHKALIVSMSSSDMLGLCATASHDRTVRIWNEINQLQKVMELNATPQTMCFSSPQGDITVCIGKHLFKIRHERYLSSKYRHKIALYQIPELIEETPKPFKRENIEVSSESYTRILQPESSLPLLSLGITGEGDRSMDMKRAKAYSQYNAREEDIISIMEGNTVASKKIPSRQLLGLKQWRTLVASINTVSGATQMLRVAGMKALNIREIRRRHTEKIQHLNLRAKYEGMFGRSPSGMAETPGLTFNPLDSPVATRGFIPNCILYKLLGMERTPTASIKSKGKKHVVLPPIFREGQEPEKWGGGDMRSRVSYTSSTLMVSGWHSRRKENESESSRGTFVTTEEEGKRTDFEESEEETDRKDFQVYSMGWPSGTPWMTVCQTQEENDTMRPATVERVEPGEETSGRKRVPMSKIKSPTKSPTGRTQSDDPEKIKKMNDLKATMECRAAMDLLERQFTSKQSPDESIALSDFVRVFGDLLGVTGSPSDIVAGMKNLYDKYPQNHRNTMKRAFIKIINTFKDAQDNRRLEKFLQFLASLDMFDKDTIVALLALYIQSGKPIRRKIMNWLTRHGLVDPQRMLEKHLDEVMEDVVKQCKLSNALDFDLVTKHVDKWLTHWQSTLEYHMDQVLQKIRAGELTTAVDSFLVKELEQMAERFLKSELREKQSCERREATPVTEMQTGKGIDGDPSNQSSKQNTIDIDLERNTMEMIVLLDDDVSKKRMRHVNPVDALNYFCELEARYKGRFQYRLRHSESCLKDIHIVPGIWGHHHKRIQIPLPTAQLAEPFNDGIHVPNPVLLTLRTSQKYFHPQSSYP